MAEPDSSRWGALALLLVSTALILGGVDFALRQLEIPELRGPLGWKLGLTTSEGTNSLGFRAAEPAASKRGQRILLLGDSQVEGPNIALHDTFARMLQRHLRRRGWRGDVVAIGASGWGTDQQLIALRMYVDELDPDLVLVFFTHSNDIWNSLFPTLFGWPKPTFQWVDGELVPPDPHLWRSVGAQPSDHSPHGLVPLVRRALVGYPTDADWEAVLPPPTPAPEATPDLQDLAAAYQARIGLVLWSGEDMQSERSHFAHLKQPPTPRLLHALALTQALVVEMKREAAARDLELRAFSPTLSLNAWEGEYAHQGRAYGLSAKAANARLRQLFAAADVPLFEIDDVGVEQTLLPEDLHLNALGNRFVAGRVGDWLLRERAVLAVPAQQE